MPVYQRFLAFGILQAKSFLRNIVSNTSTTTTTGSIVTSTLNDNVTYNYFARGGIKYEKEKHIEYGHDLIILNI